MPSSRQRPVWDSLSAADGAFRMGIRGPGQAPKWCERRWGRGWRIGASGSGSGRCDRGPQAVLLFPTPWQKYAAHTLERKRAQPTGLVLFCPLFPCRFVFIYIYMHTYIFLYFAFLCSVAGLLLLLGALGTLLVRLFVFCLLPAFLCGYYNFSICRIFICILYACILPTIPTAVSVCRSCCRLMNAPATLLVLFISSPLHDFFFFFFFSCRLAGLAF